MGDAKIRPTRDKYEQALPEATDWIFSGEQDGTIRALSDERGESHTIIPPWQVGGYMGNALEQGEWSTEAVVFS